MNRRIGLRARVTALFAVGALVVSTVVAVGAYDLTRRSLLAERERTAVRAASFDAAVVREGLRAPDPQVLDVLRTLDTGASRVPVVRRDGQWFSRSVESGAVDAVSSALRRAVESGRPAAQRVEVEGTVLQVVGVPLPSVGAAFYEVGTLDELEQTLRLLALALTAVAAVTTVAGAVLGRAATRRLLRPLAVVTGTARDIAGGDLEARLDTRVDPDLAELTVAFNSMVDDLAARLRRDRRFAGDVSHELRSPLQTLAAASSVLARRAPSLDARSQQAVELVTDEVERFGHLVTDLLALAGAERPVQRSEVDLLHLVRAVCDRRGLAPALVHLPPDAPPVLAEARRLEQVLTNLVDNAQVHGGGATAVRVEVTGAAAIRVVVEDDGPGVAPDERELVFDRFARGRVAHARGDGTGTGLGLALVAQHVAVHRGRVWVEDRVGGGARFVVELPLAPAHDAPRDAVLQHVAGQP